MDTSSGMTTVCSGRVAVVGEGVWEASVIVRPVYVGTSARGPLHLSSTEHVQVRMEDGLPRPSAGVEDQAVVAVEAVWAPRLLHGASPHTASTRSPVDRLTWIGFQHERGLPVLQVRAGGHHP